MSNERKQSRKPRFFRPGGDASSPEAKSAPKVEVKPEAETKPAPESETKAEPAPTPSTPSSQTAAPAASSTPHPEKKAEPKPKPRKSKARAPRIAKIKPAQTQPTGEQAEGQAQPQQILHQPQDKRARNETPSPFEDAAADDAAPENAEDDGRTIPTLKDIRRGFRWSAILLSAASALAFMSFTAWLTSFIDKLITRNDWVGWLAVGLVSILVFALVMIILRELFALARLGKIGKMRDRASRALKHDDRKLGENVQKEIASMLANRRALAWGLANLKENRNQVLSAHDRLTLVERSLIVPLDANARKVVADSAKRVSVMTAISPFVFLDMLLVATENFRMMRRLMTLYGGRPGVLSQFKLIQMMIASLAMSGGVAVGADLLGHVMGRQVATRLAGRIGEGMVNGSLTARLGVTATKLIRPLPYIEAKPVSIAAFIKELTSGAKKSRSG